MAEARRVESRGRPRCPDSTEANLNSHFTKHANALAQRARGDGQTRARPSSPTAAWSPTVAPEAQVLATQPPKDKHALVLILWDPSFNQEMLRAVLVNERETMAPQQLVAYMHASSSHTQNSRAGGYREFGPDRSLGPRPKLYPSPAQSNQAMRVIRE